MALGFDPLQSEPKLKRIKKSLNVYSCPQCEYILSHLKNMLKAN